MSRRPDEKSPLLQELPEQDRLVDTSAADSRIFFRRTKIRRKSEAAG